MELFTEEDDWGKGPLLVLSHLEDSLQLYPGIRMCISGKKLVFFVFHSTTSELYKCPKGKPMVKSKTNE